MTDDGFARIEDLLPRQQRGGEGYSYRSVHTWLAERGIKAVIPKRSKGTPKPLSRLMGAIG
jgi:hypothetical protein